MLLDMHHWSYSQLNETDLDDLIPYIVYWPEWKRRSEAPDKSAKLTPVDQVDWL